MKQLCCFLLVVVLLISPAFALEMGGVAIPDSLKAGETDLMLNGAGIRSKMGISVYVGGLFLSQKNDDATGILKADEPMAITLHMLRDVSSAKMTDSMNEGFKNSTKGQVAAIKPQIDEFLAVFTADPKKGNVYEFLYVPGEGVKVSINGASKTTIKGLDFKTALFGIWLCDRPAHEGLKKGMLGL